MFEVLLKNLPAVITVIVATTVIWKYARRVLNLLEEIQQFINAVLIAFADKVLTKEEIDKMIKEGRDIPEAINKLFKDAEEK